jgi:hypothetical protein
VQLVEQFNLLAVLRPEFIESPPLTTRTIMSSLHKAGTCSLAVSLPRGRKMYFLTRYLDGIFIELRIGCYDSQIFNDALRYDDSIERVAVVVWQFAKFEKMLY